MKHTKFEIQKKYWENIKGRRTPTHPVVEAFVKPKIEFINNIIIGNKNKTCNILSLLDIGSGNGFFTYYFERTYNTVALDFSSFMLDNNSSNKKVCASATKLPFKDNSFDLAFCSNLLHHLDSPEEAVSEMKRVSRKYVVLSEPNRNNPIMFMFGLCKKTEWGTLRFSLRYLKNLVSVEGLRIFSVATMGIILPNKTPELLLRILVRFDGRFKLGFYNIVIAKHTK